MTLVVIAEVTIFEDVEEEHVSEENRMKDKATSTIANCTDQILHLWQRLRTQMKKW